MSDTDETAPLAVPRDRSVEARRAARQVKAGLDRRIIESLNHGVSVLETAEREDVGRGRPGRPNSSYRRGAAGPPGNGAAKA